MGSAGSCSASPSSTHIPSPGSSVSKTLVPLLALPAHLLAAAGLSACQARLQGHVRKHFENSGQGQGYLVWTGGHSHPPLMPSSDPS